MESAVRSGLGRRRARRCDARHAEQARRTLGAGIRRQRIDGNPDRPGSRRQLVPAKQKLKGNKRYPLVLMLEPLCRCNLACVGCGKIQHPEPVLNTYLTPEECWDAAEECGAPVVSIAGGEPLVHPQIDEIVRRPRRAQEVRLSLHERDPAGARAAEAHAVAVPDDQRPHGRHARTARRDGGPRGRLRQGGRGIREAKERGFRVSTNTTVFADSKPDDMRQLFTFLSDDLKVDGMMVSPGYDYPKAPNQSGLPQAPADDRDVQGDPRAAGAQALAVLPHADVPRLPAGQAGDAVHGLGQPDPQRARLAAAVLPDERGLRLDVPSS